MGNKKSRLGRLLRALHLALGLPSGIIVMLVALTGAIHALRPDVEQLGRPDLRTKERTGAVMSPRELVDQVTSLPSAASAASAQGPYSVTYYGEERAAVVTAQAGSRVAHRYYLNPFTGELLHEEQAEGGLWSWLWAGHRRLWLPEAIGVSLIGWAQLAFVVVLLTGVILWFTKERPRLHSVLGVSTALFALVIVLTDLPERFDWWRRGYYTVITGGGRLVPWHTPQSPAIVTSPYHNPDSSLWAIARADFPLQDDGSTLTVDLPKDSLGVYGITYSPDGPLATGRRVYRFYDRYTLNEVLGGGLYGVPRERLSWGRKLYRFTEDIHTGSLLGTPGRYLVVLILLSMVALPITGLRLWWRRRPSR